MLKSLKPACLLAILTLVLTLSITLAPLAQAAMIRLTNAGFETGDLTGWDTDIPSEGYINVVTGFTGDLGTVYSAPEGSYFAELKTDGPGSYTTLSQTFKASKGDSIDGWAFFDIRESSYYEDEAQVRIMEGSTELEILFYENLSSVGSYGETPWTYWSYTFESAGTYTLEARVTNYQDSSVDAYMGLDTQFYEESHAYFTASPVMGDAPLTVQFKSQSSGDVDSYYWSFGDGGHSSSKHPSHTYQNEGSYTVTLRVSGDGGTDSFTLYNVIIVEAQTADPNLVVRDLNVSSTYVVPGQAVGVTARVYNDGGSWGSDTMNLLVNGATENSAGVGVAPGTAQTVSFTLYRTTPGEYQVTFGGATATFFVMEEAQQATPASGLLAGGELDTGGIIAIVCIAVIIVAGIVIAFLFARRT